MKFTFVSAPLLGALLSSASFAQEAVIVTETEAQVTAPAANAPPAPAFTADGTEILDNRMIIALNNAGLGPDAIIAKIRASEGNYDGSTMAMIALKDAGVPDEVIAAMLENDAEADAQITMADNESPDPMVPHSPGIYMLHDGENARMARIDPTVPTQAKTSGLLGYALTSGIASMKVKIVIPNQEARVTTADGTPTFYFFFNENHALAPVSQFGSAFSFAAVSPNEFALVEFKQKKNRREAKVGSINIGGAKAGVSDKDRIAFSYDEVRPGVFKVTLEQPLEAGEYGFLYSMGGATGTGGMAAATRIFDFTIG